MIEKSCENCGKNFKAYNYRKDTSKYCSLECYHKATRKSTISKCINCNKEFTKKYENAPQKFCCYKCFCDYKKKLPKKATLGKNGYKYVWMTDGSAKKEHIYIMENIIGRKLKKNECVHHKDGNRSNNDISNLMLMTRGEHSSLHRKLELEKGKKLFGRG